MKIALIMALQKEYDLLKDLYDFRDDRADLNGHTLILSTCGMGKVNAAMTAQKICQEGVDLILSVGVAGHFGVGARARPLSEARTRLTLRQWRPPRHGLQHDETQHRRLATFLHAGGCLCR